MRRGEAKKHSPKSRTKIFDYFIDEYHFTKLFIIYIITKRLYHAVSQATLAVVREEYWPVSGKSKEDSEELRKM